MLADLTEITKKDLNKMLLDDFAQIAEKQQIENLYVALSMNEPTLGDIARNLIVYGFEKISKEDSKRYTTNPEVMVMKLEVNQEDDFVDLY